MTRAHIITAAAVALVAACAPETSAPPERAPASAATDAPERYRLDIRVTTYAPQPTRPGTANYEAEHQTVTQYFATAEECEAQRKRWSPGDPDAIGQEPGQAARELLGIDPAAAEPGYWHAASWARCEHEMPS